MRAISTRAAPARALADFPTAGMQPFGTLVSSTHDTPLGSCDSPPIGSIVLGRLRPYSRVRGTIPSGLGGTLRDRHDSWRTDRAGHIAWLPRTTRPRPQCPPSSAGLLAASEAIASQGPPRWTSDVEWDSSAHSTSFLTSPRSRVSPALMVRSLKTAPKNPPLPRICKLVLQAGREALEPEPAVGIGLDVLGQRAWALPRPFASGFRASRARRRLGAGRRIEQPAGDCAPRLQLDLDRTLHFAAKNHRAGQPPLAVQESQLPHISGRQPGDFETPPSATICPTCPTSRSGRELGHPPAGVPRDRGPGP